MAIFKQKKNGAVVYGVRIWHAGNDIRRIVGPDRKAAEMVEAALKKEIAAAKAAGQAWTGLEEIRKAKNPKTFAEAAKEYMDERASLKPSTLTRYESILRVHLLPAFGKLELRSITESKIRTYQSHLHQATVPPPHNKKKATLEAGVKLSPVTINRIVELLRFILDASVRKGDITASPSKAVPRLQQPRQKVDPLTEEEMQLALSHMDAHYVPLFTTLAYTGARPNELLALRHSDIDWNRKEIAITKGRTRGGHEGLPKTASSDRVIPMPPVVENALQPLKESPLASLNGYVFVTKKGQPFDKGLDVVWRRALKRAGIRHRASYQCRHFFASQCLLKGIKPGYVAKLLGHTSLEMVYRVYGKWIDEASVSEENKLRNMFTGQEHLAENLAVAPNGLSSTITKRTPVAV